MPLVVRVCCIVVEMDLFPDNGLCLLCGDGIVNCCPYIVPIDLTSKMIMPFLAVMMLLVCEFNQSIIYELVCDYPKFDVFVLDCVIKCAIIPAFGILVFNLQVYSGYAFSMW